jgi:hypothetical protein
VEESAPGSFTHIGTASGLLFDLSGDIIAGRSAWEPQALRGPTTVAVHLTGVSPLGVDGARLSHPAGSTRAALQK